MSNSTLNSSSAVAECVCGDPQCEKTCPSSFPTLLVAILGSGLSLSILGIAILIFIACAVAVYKYRSARGERLDRQELMQHVEDGSDDNEVRMSDR